MKRLLPLALALAACQFTPTVEPAWIEADPTDAGFEAGAIPSLVEELRRGDHGVLDHFVLYRDGKLVADERFTPSHDKVLIDQTASPPPAMYDYANQDWHPYKEGTDLHTMQSVTKSVTSIAVGLAIDEGFIEHVDVPIRPFLDGRVIHDDPRWNDLTLRDLLTMQSGIEWSPPPGTVGYTDQHPTTLMESSDAWLPFILAHPMASEPGTRFQYVDGASVLLGEVVRRATGERIDDYLRARLFEPLGIADDFYWKITPAGEADTEGGLYLTADALMRIGVLFLQDGAWHGEQVVPAEWVRESTALHVPLTEGDPGSGYGYQWWIGRHSGGATRTFSARGYGGQFLFVSRETRTVAVFLGWDNSTPSPRLFEQRVLSSLPAGPESP